MRRKGNSSLTFIVAVAMTIIFLQVVVGIDVLNSVQMKIEEGIEIISKKGFQLVETVRFEQIKAAGVKLFPQSWEAFLQICDRLVANLGFLTVYADIEARVMFVYNTSPQPQEVYYVTF